jgi:lipopolysaccharide/colanic/teichoic acid biosynthesis glycosyltransferase
MRLDTEPSSILSCWLERAIALVITVVLSPALLAVACAVVVGDGTPVLFRQKRIGKEGKPFDLLKFRSMQNAMTGPALTSRGDARVTRVGRFIRRFKLDELPQLWNVLCGHIALIGPRPEVPCFVDFSNPLWQSTLKLKPGITGLASLLYREEEILLAQAKDPEQYYRDFLLPDKLRLNLAYARSRTVRSDLSLLWLTLLFSIAPGTHDAERVRRLFAPKG